MIYSDNYSGNISKIENNLKNWNKSITSIKNNNRKRMDKKMIKKLIIGLLNKDRGIEICLLLQSLLNQTHKDFDIIIIDDNSNNFLYENSTLLSLLKLHENINHKVQIIKGKQHGPHYAGQLLLENSKSDLILRLDDDVTLQEDCIEKLINCFNVDEDIVAVGPIYLLPFKSISEQILDYNIISNSTNTVGDIILINDKEIYVDGSLQMNLLMNSKGNVSVKHLHSGFMYKKSALEKIGGYFLGYSKVGYREESDTSYRLYLNGGKLLICPEAICFHYHPFFGGIRTDENGKPNDTSLWESDEKLFIERFKNNFKSNNNQINKNKSINEIREKLKVKPIECPTKNNFQTNKEDSKINIVLQECNKPNKNKRIYTEDVLKESTKNSFTRPNIHIVTITHGNHDKLKELMRSIYQYTKNVSSWTVINNDNSKNSIEIFNHFITKKVINNSLIDELNINFIQLDNEVSVSEARNIGATNRSDNSEYICFLDDDVLILGKWSDDDWLDIMYKEIIKESNIGAVSPIYTWFEPLESNVLSVACLLVPVKVWKQVGGFDPIFGNKDEGTWGYEDTDWSFRLQLLGYKIKAIPSKNFPLYHEDTTNKKKNEWQKKGLLKAKKLLLSKHIKNNIHIIILTYGKHQRLNRLLEEIINYTDQPYSIGIINNDSSKESHHELIKIIEKISNININYINLSKELSLGEARNMGVKLSPDNTKYLCFIDDDSQILGKFTDKDWLRQLQNLFDGEKDIGAVSPYYFWYDPLKSYTATTGCLLTSIDIWNQIGGFDPIFGKDDVFGYEDTDWCYRLYSAGYKVKEIGIKNFPYFHPSDNPEDIDQLTGEKKRPDNRLLKRLKGEKLLLSKYNIEEINKYNRTIYPFTVDQMNIKDKKLNIGSYYMKLDGFINIDINPDCNPDILGDIRKLEFDNESINLILASQVIEHFDLVNVKELLIKFYRCLSIGGHLIIEVPDVGRILDKVENKECKIEDYYGAIYGNDSVIGMKHKSQFDENLLKNMLIEAGFENIIRNNETSDDDDITLRFDAIK